MALRVTIQDIADELGISRNTVSKAINNTGVLADATRERILKKAMEMGYKQFSYMASVPGSDAVGNGSTQIALLTAAFLGDSHFATTMLDKFQRELSSLGYSLTMYRVMPHEIEARILPPAFSLEQVAGIVCVEIFDYDYCQMLCSLDKPLLFVDTPPADLRGPLRADCLYMDNTTHNYSLIHELVRRGKTEIGFVGNRHHCQSFFERYISYRNALFLAGLKDQDHFCLTEGVRDYPDYRAYLRAGFDAMERLPQVLLCANDFVAMDVLEVLRERNVRVPEDLWLCGFDDSPESRLLNPPLTTIHIHTQIMGYTAAQLLTSRIRQPSLNFRTVYAETDLIYRKSTGD